MIPVSKADLGNFLWSLEVTDRFLTTFFVKDIFLVLLNNMFNIYTDFFFQSQSSRLSIFSLSLFVFLEPFLVAFNWYFHLDCIVSSTHSLGIEFDGPDFAADKCRADPK